MWARAITAVSFYVGLALRIYLGPVISNYDSARMVVFGLVYVYSAPIPRGCWSIVLWSVAKTIAFASPSTSAMAVSMLCLLRARMQRGLAGAGDFTVITHTLVRRIGPHVIYGLAAVTTRAELIWFILAHLALGPWGIPALLMLAEPNALGDDADANDYRAYVRRRRRKIGRRLVGR